MTDDTDISIEPETQGLIERLEVDRPKPTIDFRGGLGRTLANADPGWGPRPEHLWLQAVVLILVGTSLLLFGALISVGGV